ncbi:peptidoglycan-binding domain-containing protein [Streptomyces asiaticus]|uniref:peptidoglycan-binding domain-containing protein n=1 Tax=Streptomyces asiaticus TaxID=114695 RepID=UPI002ED6593C
MGTTIKTRLGVIATASALVVTGLLAAGPTASAAVLKQATPATAASDSCGYYSGTALTVRGNTGPRVHEIQCLLNGYSGYPVALDEDSNFGPATESGVRWLQACAHITVDGKVGVNTWNALRNSAC